jgi:CRISPR-associated endonuclease/helicase Cas3
MNRRSYYAHTLLGLPESDWHPLEKHLKDSADLAKHFASGFGAAEWGRLVGMWHDLGKFRGHPRTTSNVRCDLA